MTGDNPLFRFIAKHPILSLCLGLVLVYLPVPLLIRPSLFECVNLSQTGQIGDTIGGITAPIIGLIGAIIIYISFQAQVDANKIQSQAIQEEIKRNRDEKNIDIILTLYRELREDFESLAWKEASGVEALKRFPLEADWGHTLFDETFASGYLLAWNEMRLVLERIEALEENDENRALMLTKLSLFYVAKMKEGTDALITRASNAHIPNSRYGELLKPLRDRMEQII